MGFGSSVFVDMVGCRIRKGYTDVVDCRGRGFGFAVIRRRNVGFVDANCVVELDRRKRAQVWLENVGKVREGKLLLVEELRGVS